MTISYKKYVLKIMQYQKIYDKYQKKHKDYQITLLFRYKVFQVNNRKKF